ncbi:hypothetical protein K402DRAFT_408110 [Aulographum hederae CBS 113979]|uniref:DUF7918 domain-containing protein n=1 Tax=Aulographum hederae CBS 113979 TaxID=1176131 RepID=A0A6G1GMC9_9PEZI|nr:hypothetical protein K402DRAFT_408110 [Aulographum hederae CBS 113979]
MYHPDGFEVFLESRDDSFQEIFEPSISQGSRKDRTCYIPCSGNNETFAVVVRILPSFDYCNAPFLRITVEFDDSNITWTWYRKYERVSRDPKTYRFSSIKERDGDGTWRHADLAFRDSESDKSMMVAESASTQQKAILEVNVQRCYMASLGRPITAKFAERSHGRVSKNVNGKRARKPRQIFGYKPIIGDMGKPMSTVFLYRTKAKLERLGLLRPLTLPTLSKYIDLILDDSDEEEEEVIENERVNDETDARAEAHAAPEIPRHDSERPTVLPNRTAREPSWGSIYRDPTPPSDRTKQIGPTTSKAKSPSPVERVDSPFEQWKAGVPLGEESEDEEEQTVQNNFSFESRLSPSRNIHGASPSGEKTCNGSYRLPPSPRRSSTPNASARVETPFNIFEDYDPVSPLFVPVDNSPSAPSDPAHIRDDRSPTLADVDFPATPAIGGKAKIDRKGKGRAESPPSTPRSNRKAEASSSTKGKRRLRPFERNVDTPGQKKITTFFTPRSKASSSQRLSHQSASVSKPKTQTPSPLPSNTPPNPITSTPPPPPPPRPRIRLHSPIPNDPQYENDKIAPRADSLLASPSTPNGERRQHKPDWPPAAPQGTNYAQGFGRLLSAMELRAIRHVSPALGEVDTSPVEEDIPAVGLMGGGATRSPTVEEEVPPTAPPMSGRTRSPILNPDQEMTEWTNSGRPARSARPKDSMKEPPPIGRPFGWTGRGSRKEDEEYEPGNSQESH